MKNLWIFYTGLIFITSAPGLNAQELIKNTHITSTCYAGNKVKRVYIPPPEEFYKKRGQKGGASITFNYTGFSATGITAMEWAGSILETILPSDVHITVVATWMNISPAGILANSTTTGFVGGWSIDAWKPWAIYPVALAEKIAGKSLNEDSNGDIELNINSSVNWYLGTDGNVPPNKYDLITVVIHELIHGLGFLDSFRVNGSLGSYGISSVPMIYDSFVEDYTGNNLTDTLLYINPSAALKTRITSGSLYFDGPLLKNYTSGVRARLYAPSPFDEGSSVSHLDEDTYPTGDALMTPYIDLREAIHDPGKFTMSILGDVGWINTRIIHETLKDTEESLSNITISATIKSDTAYNHNKVGLVYSFNNFATSQAVYMTSPQSDNNYTTTIAIPSYNTRVDYYLSAVDCFSRSYRSPSTVHESHYSFFIGTDTVKPVIKHTSQEYYLEKIDTIKFNAVVTDNIGVDTVYLEYKINNGPSNYLGLKPFENDGYSNFLKAKTLSLAAGDSIKYRIIALDKAALPNQKILPANGYFSVNIERIDPVATSYTTDFSDASADFLNNGFYISKPDGFSNYGLHTVHPYVSPGETGTGDSIGYTAMLRTPVIFDVNGMIIRYSEVVLVEPGEEGYLFGSIYFYDYVIVEGSRNFGKTWFHLADGYDSRYKDAWLTAYKSAISGDNSTYVGNESLLMNHSIYPKVSSDFSAGDTLMVRFRLFSDPLANGWGWVIEGLHIGPLINSIQDVSYQPLVIYPDPGDGHFTIKQPGNINLKQISYKIYSSTGACLITGKTDGSEELKIDISSYPSALYFIVLYKGNEIQTLKYNLIK
jgi:hypothetical protein